MTASELAEELFRRGKKVVPKRILDWHQWEVPINGNEAQMLDVKWRFYTEAERKFGEFTWHIENLNGMKLVVRCPSTGRSFKENVDVLRGPVERGIE